MKGTTLLVCIFTAIVCYNLIMRLTHHLVRKKIDAMFSRGDLDSLDHYLTRRISKFALGRYGAGIARFNVLVQQGNSKAAKDVITELLGMKLPVRQRQECILKAFSFFLGQGDNTAAQVLLPEIRHVMPRETSNDCEISYDILSCHDSSHIAEMKSRFSNASALKRLEFAYLLSVQYKNLGNDVEAARWREQFRRLAEKSKMQTILYT